MIPRPSLSGLETRHIASVPVGVYNGKEFLFRTGWWKLINIVRCVLRYGTSLLTIYSSVTSVLNQISNIYSLQSRGEVYHTVPDMLRAMGGEELYHLTQISAKQYLQQELRLQETLMNEVITAAIYTYCGQGLEEVNACTCMVSLNGIQRENIWSVVGGNCLIPQTALVRSGAELYKCSVTSITRTVGDGGRVSYSIQTDESGEQASEMGEYDAVIVATPLYEQSIQFKNFPTPVYTEEITATMYQRSVMEFVDGEVNPAFFGLEDNDRTFPLIILSCDFVEGSPAFCSFGKSMVAGASDSELEKYNKPMPEEPSRVWKLHTPQPLTREEKQQMFKKINAEATVDWLAFPKCSPPESFPPFELDTGVFYVNGIEKAASIMEMSAIAAKNCALLARQYLKNK